MCEDRPWVITAPWWRWPKLGAAGRDPRATAPVIQKYDRSDPVSGFVKEPQKTLAYGADDVVQQVMPYAAPAGKKTRLSDWYLVPTTTRKVFLPSHKRFYLVVCELHCDSRGLPSVSRDKVCETGFVVRRRQLSFAPEHAPEAAGILADIGSLTARIAEIDRGGGRLLKKRVQVTGGGVFGASASPAASSSRVDDKVAARRADLQAQLSAARARLARWKNDAGAVSVAEGWVADPTAENVGAWQVVQDAPAAVEEVVYPLSALVADPRSASHDAAGKTIWFGMIHAGSREVDASGKPRFDEATRYEVRCFVRRHRCDCPKTGERNDCGGELVWSAPAEAFQLAPHFDPVGTGNHPVHIQMPDIPTLAATVGARLPVAMHFPVSSALNISADKDSKPQNPGTNATAAQICFFSIPLITIVATFVLNLFLPIVVFLFGLWFLLGLKFCIPPSLSVAGGIDLNLQANLSASIDVALSASVGVDANAVLTGNLGADLNMALAGRLDAAETSPGSGNYTPNGATVGATLTSAFTNTALGPLDRVAGRDHKAEVNATDITAGTLWVPRVERWEVGA